MSLKNTPDFRSEVTDEASIQDHIDNSPVLNASRTDIALLEREIFSKVDTVTVHTFDSGDAGRLIVRTAAVVNTFNDTDTGKRIEDDRELRVINTDGNDHLIAENGKLYIHVSLPDGSTGYVAADYVRAPKLEAPIITTEQEPSYEASPGSVTPSYKPEVIAPDDAEKAPEALVKPETGELPYDDSPPNYGDTPLTDEPYQNETLPDEGKEPDVAKPSYEASEENPDETTYILRDGVIWLAHEDGEERISEVQKIKSIEKAYPGLSEYIAIWKLKAEKTVEGLYFKSFRSGDEEMRESMKTIEELTAKLIIAINTPGNDGKAEVESIFAEMAKYDKRQDAYLGASNPDVYGNDILDNIHTVSDLLTNNPSMAEEEKLIQMYNLTRTGWSQNGDSQLIKGFVTDRLIQKPYYEGVQDLLQSADFVELIKNGKKDEIKQLINKALPKEFNPAELNDIVTELSTSFSKIRRKIMKVENYDLLAEQVDAANKKLKAAGKPELVLSEVADTQIQIALEAYMKDSFVYRLVAKEDDRGGTDNLQGLYADMSGLAESSTWDWIDMADENIDAAIDLSLIAVTSLLPLGVGAVAASALIKGVSVGARALGAGKITDSSNKFVRGVGTVGAWGGKSSIGGLAFYEASNPFHNMLRKDDVFTSGFFEGSGDIHEIRKSVAFFGALGVLRPVLGKLGSTRIGDKMNINKFTRGLKGIGSITVQAAALVGVSQEIEIQFGDTDRDIENYTWEEFVQALIMVAALKGAGKAVDRIKLSRTKDGSIGVTPTGPINTIKVEPISIGRNVPKAEARTTIETRTVTAEQLASQQGPLRAQASGVIGTRTKTTGENPGVLIGQVLPPLGKSSGVKTTQPQRRITQENQPRIEDMRTTRPQRIETISTRTEVPFTSASGKSFTISRDPAGNIVVQNSKGITLNEGVVKSMLNRNPQTKRAYEEALGKLK